MADAIELRLPDLRLRPLELASEPQSGCEDRLHAFVEVRGGDEDVWELTLIFSDGRAWFRSIASQRDEAERTLASALANLLAGIDEDDVAPDVENIELPTELTEPEPEPKPEPELESELEPEPKPEPEPEPRRPSVELAPRIGAGALLGLTPTPGLRGVAGELGLDLRLRKGSMFGLDLRVLGARDASLSLTRIRARVGVGYGLRIARFELPILAMVGVEPWLLHDGSSRVDLRAPPLIGAGLRLAPSVRFAFGDRWLRVGVPLGLELAFEPGQGALVPAIKRSADAAPSFRVGGLELSIGLELAHGWRLNKS